MTNSLELFSIFCLWSNKLVQSCYLITVLLHLSVIPQWYYKNGYKYFYSVLNTLHKPSSRLVLPKYLRFHIKNLIPTLKLYQSKTSTLNLTCFVETKIPVQAFIRIKYYLQAQVHDLFWNFYSVLECLLSSFASLPSAVKGLLRVGE